jgi:hypothetical protein
VAERSTDIHLAEGTAGLSINDDGVAVEDVPSIDDIPDMDDEEAGLGSGVVEIEDPSAIHIDNSKYVPPSISSPSRHEWTVDIFIIGLSARPHPTT